MVGTVTQGLGIVGACVTVTVTRRRNENGCVDELIGQAHLLSVNSEALGLVASSVGGGDMTESLAESAGKTSVLCLA